MEPYQQRVVDEKMELDAKLAKLIEFRTTDTFAGLDAEERFRLLRQYDAMANYSVVLGERISAFKHP